MNMKQQILLAGLALLMLPAARASSAIEESRPMPKDGLLQVENLAGSIEITTWDRAEVSITGELGDDVEKLEIEESTAGLEIRVRNRKSRRNVDETRLQLQIPVSASIEAESVSADISVRDSRGASVVLHSVSGDLEIDAETERLEAESVSGDVSFSGHTLRASVETVSGEIDLQGLEREIRISTVSGDVELAGARVDRGRFETVSGDLDIELDVTDGGRLNVQSMSGDVRLALPEAQQAEFTAQTFSGDIRSGFGTVERSTHGPGQTFSYREGSNGATIKLESFSGDIRLIGR
jgi:DUF4097 and DUF4098 domain-containing protein YvlB